VTKTALFDWVACQDDLAIAVRRVYRTEAQSLPPGWCGRWGVTL